MAWWWLWCCLVAWAQVDLHLPAPTVGRSALEPELVAWMDDLLDDPDGYRRLVEREAWAFPEGSLFPYVFPALAWTNLAAREPARRPEAREHIAALIELMLPEVIRHVGPPERDLSRLTGYRGQAVMLGQLDLVLGCWKLVGGDDRYRAMHDRITQVLAEALRERDGAPLESYPALVWPFDTIPVILALHLADPVAYADVVDAHLAWIDAHGLDPVTGLPYSRLDPATLKPVVGPRGCDASYRIPLIAQIDPARARDLYRRHVEVFWIRRPLGAGFAEWPHGRSNHADIDSGPVVMGIGTSATGFGIAATRAAGDGARWQTLERQLAVAHDLVERFGPAAARLPVFDDIPFDPDRYRTGFLFGDICLLWSITWEPWGTARAPTENPPSTGRSPRAPRRSSR